MLNWDDVRIFLAVARSGRFVTAGKRLGIDHTTVARRISALEASVGSRLLDRSPRGVTLTLEGQRLLGHAQRVEEEMLAAADDVAHADERLAGPVRLATPAGLGTYVIAPQVRRFVDEYPEIELSLIPESKAFSLAQREADILVGLHRPMHGNLVSQRLADYWLGLYASPEYLARRPPIRSVADLAAHDFVWSVSDLVGFSEIKVLDHIAKDSRIALRSSSVHVQHTAVASGLGIGLLHGFAAAHDARLVPVLEGEVHEMRTYWLSVHANYRSMPRVRAVIDFLHALVSEGRPHLMA
jgi:DNA-binding transcriptional LysR family regulator